MELLPSFKEEKTQKFTTIVLTLVAVIFFGLFALSPTLSTIAQLQKELSDDQAVDQALQTKINNLSTLQDKYAQIEQDIPVVLSAIPQKPDVPLVMAQVQALMNKYNLTLTTFQTNQVVADTNLPPKKFYSYNFNFSADGNYSDISSFLSDVTNFQRILTVDSLTVTKKSDIGNSLQVSIRGTVYFKQ